MSKLAVRILSTFLFVALPTAAHASNGDCGQPSSQSLAPKTADALTTLKSAVGQATACDSDPCICDTTGDAVITTSDALRTLRSAVGQSVALACDCADDCVTLGSAPAAGFGAAFDAHVQQVQIDVRIAAVESSLIDKLGVDFDLAAAVSTQASIPPGGTSAEPATVAVSSNASGGPPNVTYLLSEQHTPDLMMPVINPNFVSPFNGVKAFVPVAPSRCVGFESSAKTAVQQYPDPAPVQNLAPYSPGYMGATLFYETMSPQQAATVQQAISNDAGSVLLPALGARLYSGQPVVFMVDDQQPTTSQVEPTFRSKVQAVTMSPFGIFTGPAIDVSPRIDGSSVFVELRLETQILSFFYSTAFMVGAAQADAEMPVHRRSLDVARLTVASGQTVVLGGFQGSGMARRSGIPGIGAVPVLGSPAHHRIDPTKQELVVFLTPTIVSGE